MPLRVGPRTLRGVLGVCVLLVLVRLLGPLDDEDLRVGRVELEVFAGAGGAAAPREQHHDGGEGGEQRGRPERDADHLHRGEAPHERPVPRLRPVL